MNNKLLYINIDGFSYAYLEQLQRYFPDGPFSKLVQKGLLFTQLRSGIVSITNPMQSAILCGAWSNRTHNFYQHYDWENACVVKHRRTCDAENVAQLFLRNGKTVASIHQFMLENNPVLDAIRSRRSIRKYTGEPIAEPVRRAILEAGFYAPSAMNRRPFHFVSITDRELMQKLSDLHPYAKMLPQADWAIIVCGDESVSGPFYMDDCAAATQNILLAAHSLGVGAVWCGVDHTERQQSFGELLGLPEHIKAYSLIVLGMPAEEKETLDRVEPDKIHENRW